MSLQIVGLIVLARCRMFRSSGFLAGLSAGVRLVPSPTQAAAVRTAHERHEEGQGMDAHRTG